MPPTFWITYSLIGGFKLSLLFTVTVMKIYFDRLSKFFYCISTRLIYGTFLFVRGKTCSGYNFVQYLFRVLFTDSPWKTRHLGYEFPNGQWQCTDHMWSSGHLGTFIQPWFYRKQASNYEGHFMVRTHSTSYYSCGIAFLWKNKTKQNTY